MKKTLTIDEAMTELLTDQYADWTHHEAEALVLFFDELEAELGEQIEFDPVAIRCDWTKATEEEAREMYSIEGDVREYLNDHGYCLKVEGKLLFLNF